tara:strand:+ start:379 stop:561 length:183 start_codon:yes stop_codon:yes gene_type:complete
MTQKITSPELIVKFWKDSVFDQLEEYTRNMSKEDILKSFISFLPQSQIEELKDSLDRDYF